MSTRDAQPIFAKTTGGIINRETDSPDQLGLFQTDSALGAETLNSLIVETAQLHNDPFAESQENLQNNPVSDFERQIQSSVRSSPTPCRSPLSPSDEELLSPLLEKQSEQFASGIDSPIRQESDPLNAVKNKTSKTSVPTAQNSEHLRYSVHPKSPDLSPSDLAKVFHQAENFENRNDGDDKWGEDEEQREEENILISHPVSPDGAEGSDICEAEDTDSDAEGEKSAIVRTSPSLVESRSSSQSSKNKNTLFSNSSAYSRPGLPSPDLQNPQHQRFIIPYASRRLKSQTPRNSTLSRAKAAEGQTDLKQTHTVLRGDSWRAEVGAKPFNINSISQLEDEQPLSSPLKGEEEKDFDGFHPTNSSDELQDSLKVSHSDADLSNNHFELDRTLPVPNPPVESSKGIGDVTLTILTSGAPRYSSAEHHRTLKSPSLSGKEPSSMPTVKEPERVYVESPTFTRDEEEQYRFVSSRVEDYVEHDRHPTFRGLDEGAVKSMEEASGRMQPVKKPVKQVRYVDDEDRYEDRNETLQPIGRMMQGKSERQDIPPQKQYVMKSKAESASGQRLSGTRPVQGLVLPSGPSFDPEDEEDLKKEISYQEQLKSRISEAQRVAEETTVPRLPLWDGDSEDFVQDSLDVPEDIELDSERHKHHRDSVDIYHHQQRQPPQNIHNMEWGNPPAPPPAVVPHIDFSAQPSQPNPSPQAFSHDGLAFNYDTREGYVGARFSNAYEQPRASNRDPVMPQRHPQYYPEEELAHQHAHFSHGYAPLKQQQQSSQFRQLPYPQSQQDSYYAPQHQQLQDRHHQQHSQQQNAYYLQEQDQYLSDVDPAFQGQHPRVVGTGHYMDRGGPPHLGYVAPQAEVQDGYYVTETQSYGSGRGDGHQNQPNLEGGGVYGNSAKFFDQNSYEAEDEVPQLYAEHEGNIPLDMSKPPKPSYDYINNNKIDYGRAPRRTYKKIHEVKKDEKEKLADIFVTPKSKIKSSDSQLSSRDNSLKRYPAIAEHPGQEMGVTSDAEHLWAHRSATLAQTRMPGRKKQHSNTSLMSIKSQQMNLTNTSLPSSRSRVDPVHLPLRRPLELKPVHQEVITEDGQRISVDVNLRLISPTAQGEHEHLGHENVASSKHSGPIGEPRQRWPGQPYPADNALASGQQPYAFQNENEYQQGRYSADDAFASKKHGGLASGYLSDSHHDYNGGHTVNPFPKIPPIPIGSDDGAPRSAPVLSEGSYMQTYLREKEKMEKGEKPWYRVYSLQDYKRMQKEVCLGTLGPDLDSETFKEKREKMLRQNEYARSVKEKNSKERINRKPPAVPKPKEQSDIINKRILAIEYAKNVPKPTVKPKPTPYNSYTLASQLSPIAKNSGKGQQQNSFPEPSVEMLDLERLHQRHEEDKRSAEQIRQKAQGIW